MGKCEQHTNYGDAIAVALRIIRHTPGRVSTRCEMQLQRLSCPTSRATPRPAMRVRCMASAQATSVVQLQAVPLTPETFKPFGQVTCKGIGRVDEHACLLKKGLRSHAHAVVAHGPTQALHE